MFQCNNHNHGIYSSFSLTGTHEQLHKQPDCTAKVCQACGVSLM